MTISTARRLSENMKAIISVANAARGVGKTTTAVHLAAELALRDFETLLIDADPQAEATAHLVDIESVRRSVADVLFTPEPRRHNGQSIGTGIVLSDVLMPTAVARLRLAPATIRLAAAEGEAPLSIRGLHSQLKSLERHYDFVVIDMPSSLGAITAACLFASTHLVVPLAPRGQGALGLRHLVEKLGNMPCAHGSLELLGVVCNLFECRQHSSGEFVESVRREWGGMVFETIVHRDELIESCADRRRPVQLLSPYSVAATVYSELTDEIMSRLGVTAFAGSPVR